MEKLLKLIKNPKELYLFWIKISIVIIAVIIPIITFGSPGGEQKLFIYIYHYINFGIYVSLAISIITSFTNVKWFRKCWYINSVVFLFCCTIIIATYMTKEDLYKTLNTEYKGDSVIKIRRAYYVENRQLKSERFFIDSKKDSVWTYFDTEGNMTRIIEYKQDSIVKDSVIQIPK